MRTPDRSRPRRGLTLLELLLVMALLGTILGVGLGAFASLDLAGARAGSIVVGALREARGAALARRAPAHVRIDPDGRRLVASGLSVLGTWQFETEDLAGAPPVSASSTGARLAEGWLGRALELGGTPGSHAAFALDEDPAFDFTHGFALECALAPDAPLSAHVVSVGGAFGLFARADGGLRAWFAPRAPRDQGAARVPPSGARVVIDSAPGVAPVGRFALARASFDGRRFALAVDGVVVAETEEEAAVARLAGPLVLGGGEHPFAGRVDRLVLSAWVEGAEHVLPEGARIAGDAPREVAFDASGALDRSRHPEPLELVVEREEGRAERVRVGAWGTIE